MPKSPVEFLLQPVNRIANRRVRGVAMFIALFAISLLIGRVCETFFSKEALNAAKSSQAAWMHKLQTMSPLTLAKNYFEDFGPAQRGEFIYKAPPPPPPPLSDAELQDIRESAARISACDLARLMPAESPQCAELRRTPYLQSTCMTVGDAENCAAYDACTKEMTAAIGKTPPGCEDVPARDWRTGAGIQGLLNSAPATVTQTPPLGSAAREPVKVIPIFLPFAALIRTVSRLFSGGLWGGFLGAAQIGVGFLALITVMEKTSNGGDIGFGGGLQNLMGFPVATIGLASGLAFVLKWLMLGALMAFHWVTGLAAAAAGASGVVGFCWFCSTKLAEKGVESALVGGAHSAQSHALKK